MPRSARVAHSLPLVRDAHCERHKSTSAPAEERGWSAGLREGSTWVLGNISRGSGNFMRGDQWAACEDKAVAARMPPGRSEAAREDETVAARMPPGRGRRERRKMPPGRREAVREDETVAARNAPWPQRGRPRGRDCHRKNAPWPQRGRPRGRDCRRKNAPWPGRPRRNMTTVICRSNRASTLDVLNQEAEWLITQH